MKPLIDILESRIAGVLSKLAGQPVQAIIKSTQDPKFGDYQANGVMGLAKKLGHNPRQLAQQVVEQLDLNDICEKPEIAGPGFINLRLKKEFIAARLAEMLNDSARLGVELQGQAPVTVVDFSGPNLAKEMHVGHLRSTIIGDVIAKTLEFLAGNPARIIRQNHVGDWGTQFGMLVAYLKRAHPQTIDRPESFHIADLEEFYRSAKKLFDSDESFKQQAWQETVLLQSHNPQSLALWRCFLNESMAHCQEVYRRLNVQLGPEHVRGESAYGQNLPDVIGDLDKAGLLQTSEGARCVFMDAFKTREGEVLPLIVQKSDGAYLYATTDLAAIRYRVSQLQASRIIYVTDARQNLHFEMVFACARLAGWAPESVRLEHVPFGSVMGDDGKPFKTRSGENVKLKELLEEATSRARRVVEDKSPELDENRKQDIARTVGIGAVKYADLSNNLVSDYVFNWDKMLAMEGNTAPYMQYAYARVQSIFRKGEIDQNASRTSAGQLLLADPAELALAKALQRYNEVVESVGRDLRPHLLTTYLFELAQNFSAFYNACPVLKADEPHKTSRLLLCRLTASIIHHGLELLGIECPEQM